MVASIVDQNFADRGTDFFVEIAGWFVGEKQFGSGYYCSRYGHALLFAAGKMSHRMVRARLKSDFAETVSRKFQSAILLVTRDQERKGNVLNRRKVRQQVVKLKNEPDLLNMTTIAF